MGTNICRLCGFLMLLLLTSAAFAQTVPSFTIHDDIVIQGDIINLDVTVENFDQIISTTFNVSWDSMHLRYVANFAGCNNTKSRRFFTPYKGEGAQTGRPAVFAALLALQPVEW
ncbi:MAG: hypothetical protein R2795_17655 [Saprospiraceae bacterium]